MKSAIRYVEVDGKTVRKLMFVCPGCASDGTSGIHMLTVEGDTPAWDWNGKTDTPTLKPSILTRRRGRRVCHSFLTDGVFEFLNDSTHKYAGQKVEMPDLPTWAQREVEVEEHHADHRRY